MQSLDEIYLGARAIADASARAAYLEAACGDDVELRRRVDAMLADAAGADDFFHTQDEPVFARGDADAAGTVIGRYKLLQKIGEGGMGVVYMAEQREPVVRKVALKIIKAGMDTRQVVARFVAERQALALMDHPNIAKVFDGGSTGNPLTRPSDTLSPAGRKGRGEGDITLSTGRPYFVMELVQGLPITQFCDEARLSTRERLDLFLEVCSAIQHAHQKGIIHRDIKPSNILVTLHGDKPVPKVIDFGIAKATQQPLTDRTLFTQFQHFIGTPAYMSPEQASLSGLDIDTRSDIYGLGVLLYELLTGKTPFDGKELLKSGLDEMRRTIREKEPAWPSTRLRTLTNEDLTTTAQHRRTEAPRLINALRGDLDWIAMKCLEKDRDGRYETASALSADIHRHIHSEPVAARPPSHSYRLRKFVQRHRLPVAAGTFALAVLIVAVVVSAGQARRANRERARAEHRLQATVQLMNEAFENVVPSLTYTIGASKPREDLARAAVAIANELENETDLSPQLSNLLGQLYLQNAYVQSYYFANTTGNYEQGLEFALRAMRRFDHRRTNDVDGVLLERLARAQMCAGFSAYGLMRWEDALDYFKRMEQTARLLSQSTNASFARTGAMLRQWSQGLSGWTFLEMERPAEALTNYLAPLLEGMKTRVSDLTKASFTDVWDLRDLYNYAGRCQLALGRPEEAVEHLRRALELAELNDRRQPNHAACATMLVESKARLGEALLWLGKPEAAMPLFDAALQRVDELRKSDPANPGFAQLKVQTRGCYAAGYIAWANLEADPEVERLQRLEKAGEMLKRADESVARIKSESLRKFLARDLDRIRKTSEQVKGGLNRREAGASR